MTRASEVHYLLGHTADELDRLDLQGRVFRDVTVRAFRDAGIAAGMRVLDLGCGSGDVSITVAGLVGPKGRVVGVDRGEAAVEAARARAQSRGVTNVEFRCTQIEDVDDPAGFDAVVGRFVLMHQSRPADLLRTVAAQLRPGAVICMVESYMEGLLSGAHSEPRSAVYDEIVQWKGAVVGGAGADRRAGVRLPGIFVDAGLPRPTTRMEADVASDPDGLYFEFLERSLASMQPDARRQGIGGLTDADPSAVVERLRDEVRRSGASLVTWPVVAAWCRVEGATPP